MSMIDWGEFAGPASGDWQKFRFETPGDHISGVVVEARIATMSDGARMPALTIRNEGGDWSLLASQVALQRALADSRPASGDTIGIVYTGDGEAKPGKSAPKLFDVVVKRQDSVSSVVPTAIVPPGAVTAADLI